LPADLKGQTAQDRRRHLGTSAAVGGGVSRAGAAFDKVRYFSHI
jgi:hypothetical protein